MKNNNEGNINVRTSIRVIELTSKKGVTEFIKDSIDEIKINSQEHDLIKIIFFINPTLDRKIRNKKKYFSRIRKKHTDIWIKFYRLPDNLRDGLSIEHAKELIKDEDYELKDLIKQFNKDNR